MIKQFQNRSHISLQMADQLENIHVAVMLRGETSSQKKVWSNSAFAQASFSFLHVVSSSCTAAREVDSPDETLAQHIATRLITACNFSPIRKHSISGESHTHKLQIARGLMESFIEWSGAKRLHTSLTFLPSHLSLQHLHLLTSSEAVFSHVLPVHGGKGKTAKHAKVAGVPTAILFNLIPTRVL